MPESPRTPPHLPCSVPSQPHTLEYQSLTQQLGYFVTSSLFLLGILWIWGKEMGKLPLQTTGFSSEEEATAFQSGAILLGFQDP